MNGQASISAECRHSRCTFGTSCGTFGRGTHADSWHPELENIYDARGLFGGRTRTRTWDPLIKSYVHPFFRKSLAWKMNGLCPIIIIHISLIIWFADRA